jgi:hypothetical protein
MMKLNGQGYLYHCPSARLKTLQQLLASGPKWAYIADLAKADLVYCTSDLPEHWPEGRAFGTQQDEFKPEEPVGLEVRWQLVDSEEQVYGVYILTEDVDLSLPGEEGEDWRRITEEVDGLRARDILLWGEMDRTYSDDPDWMVARIPQVLKYPLRLTKEAWPDDPDRHPLMLRAVIRGYDYTIGGVPVATRWAWLQQGQRLEIVKKE